MQSEPGKLDECGNQSSASEDEDDEDDGEGEEAPIPSRAVLPDRVSADAGSDVPGAEECKGFDAASSTVAPSFPAAPSAATSAGGPAAAAATAPGKMKKGRRVRFRRAAHSPTTDHLPDDGGDAVEPTVPARHDVTPSAPAKPQIATPATGTAPQPDVPSGAVLGQVLSPVRLTREESSSTTPTTTTTEMDMDTFVHRTAHGDMRVPSWVTVRWGRGLHLATPLRVSRVLRHGVCCAGMALWYD